jgi:peroxiredoxin
MASNEQNSETNLGVWVNDRLSALNSDEQWQPNKSRALARLKEKREAKNGRHRRWAWVVSGAAVACLPLMAIPSAREFAQRCVSACVSESGWVAQLLKVKGSHPSVVYVKSDERRMAPDFTLSDSSGKPVKLSELRGNVVLLNFWATWCGPCKVEIPWFKEFQQDYRRRGFAVVGVSLDEDGWNAVKPYVDAHAVNYRVVVGNDNLAQLYGGLESLPTTLIIDRSGRIAANHTGLCSRSEYESDIQAVLNEHK